MQAEPRQAHNETPSYLGKNRASRHAAFGTRSVPKERTLQQQQLVLEAIGQGDGRALSALDLNRHLQRRGIDLKIHTLYRVLKQLLDDGKVQHEWSERNGRPTACYRVSGDAALTRVLLICKVCGTSRNLPNVGAFTRLLENACASEGRLWGIQPLEVYMVCDAHAQA